MFCSLPPHLLYVDQIVYFPSRHTTSFQCWYDVERHRTSTVCVSTTSCVYWVTLFFLPPDWKRLFWGDFYPFRVHTLLGRLMPVHQYNKHVISNTLVSKLFNLKLFKISLKTVILDYLNCEAVKFHQKLIILISCRPEIYKPEF